jgi:hypothetical protein
MGDVDKTLLTLNHDTEFLLVQICMDDIIFGGSSLTLVSKFQEMMKSEFQMSMMRELTFSLGIQVKQTKQGTFVHQAQYTKDLMKKFNMEELKLVSTPMSFAASLGPDEDVEAVDQREYRSMIGSLPYLTATRPVVTVSSGLAPKPAATVSGGLASKPPVMVFFGLASKPVMTVLSSLTSKLVVKVFSNLASKLVATVSPVLASKPAVGFLVEPQNQGGGGFPDLGLKTGSSGSVIWASKSLRQFLGLRLKTKQASVCRLRHKTDGGRSAWDTC